jgi:hypothetical protein
MALFCENDMHMFSYHHENISLLNIGIEKLKKKKKESRSDFVFNLHHFVYYAWT